MPADSGKLSDNPDDGDRREDIRWFENYEKRNGRPASLRNRDILSYIRDIEQNCRLEVSGGDEDRNAGAKRSSNCSVRFSGATAVRSTKKPRSRATSERGANAIASRRERIERSYDRNVADASCAYRFRASRDKSQPRDAPTYGGDSRGGFSNVSPGPAVYRYSGSLSERNLRGYRAESSPTRFYGRYSRRSRKARRTADTETTSLEVIEDRSADVSPDDLRGVERSRVTGGRYSARARTLESPRGGRLKSNEGESYVVVGDRSVNRRPLARRFYPGRDTDESTTRDHQALLRNRGYGARDAGNRYRYPARILALSSFHGRSSRSDRSMISTRPNPPATISRSMSRRRISWRRSHETVLPLEAPVAGSSIDRRSAGQAREWLYEKDSTSPGERTRVSREQHCHYCEPYLAGQSGRLCELIRSRDAKRRFGRCCEENDTTVDCNEYCRYPENASGPDRPIGTSGGIDYAARGGRFCGTRFCGSRIDSETNNAETSDRDLSTEGSQRDAIAEESRLRSGTSRRRHDGVIRSGRSSELSFANNNRTCRARRSREVFREHGKLGGDARNGRGGVGTATAGAPRRWVATKASREGIHGGEAGTLGTRELASSRAQAACECREAFHERPAACLVGSCTCARCDTENGESGESADSSRERVSPCCCSSPSSQDEEGDPVRKLESFCERVKSAVNRDVEPSISRGDEFGRSEAESTPRRTPRRNERPKRYHHGARRRDGANLERFLIYPPRGAGGPPLTLYKRSSNINCLVKGDATTGFRYDVTYVQKFVSPTWMPDLSPRGTNEECACVADHG